MIFKDRSSQYRSFCPMKKRGELITRHAEALTSKASINYSREKSCVCGKHCGLQGFQAGSMYLHKWSFTTHEGLSAHAHNNYCARG